MHTLGDFNTIDQLNSCTVKTNNLKFRIQVSIKSSQVTFSKQVSSKARWHSVTS